MRRIILLITFVIPILCFSQKNEKQISQVDFIANSNEVYSIRMRQNFADHIIQLMARVRQLETGEFFVGYVIPLDSFGIIVPSFGLGYNPSIKEFDILARAEYRNPTNWGIIRVTYGSNGFTRHGVSTSLMLNVFEPRYRIGVATNNEHIGPRLEALISLDKTSKKTARAAISYLDDTIVLSLRIRFGGTFKKEL